MLTIDNLWTLSLNIISRKSVRNIIVNNVLKLFLTVRFVFRLCDAKQKRFVKWWTHDNSFIRFSGASRHCSIHDVKILRKRVRVLVPGELTPVEKQSVRIKFSSYRRSRIRLAHHPESGRVVFRRPGRVVFRSRRESITPWSSFVI